jgi:hypothetical protein
LQSPQLVLNMTSNQAFTPHALLRSGVSANQPAALTTAVSGELIVSIFRYKVARYFTASTSAPSNAYFGFPSSGMWPQLAIQVESTELTPAVIIDASPELVAALSRLPPGAFEDALRSAQATYSSASSFKPTPFRPASIPSQTQDSSTSLPRSLASTGQQPLVGTSSGPHQCSKTVATSASDTVDAATTCTGKPHLL